MPQPKNKKNKSDLSEPRGLQLVLMTTDGWRKNSWCCLPGHRQAGISTGEWEQQVAYTSFKGQVLVSLLVKTSETFIWFTNSSCIIPPTFHLIRWQVVLYYRGICPALSCAPRLCLSLLPLEKTLSSFLKVILFHLILYLLLLKGK